MRDLVSTIVMTGGTSGFGATAATLIERSGHRVVLGARRPTSDGAVIPVDLARLDSVRAFAASVRERLGRTPLDALVLNAGAIHRDDTDRTVDGYETTFAVNHLAHYLLIRLLLPSLSTGAVVVLTTSGTHDPATGAGLRTPRHADVSLLAHPEDDVGRDRRPRAAGEHAYTASKLCNVVTARSLSRHPDVRARDVTAIAYCPGQVFGTGLARELPLHLRAAWSLLGSPLGAPVRRFDPHLHSRQVAARTLADLALGLASPPPGHVYAALRRGRLTWPDPSESARDDETERRVWHDSGRLVGLAA